MYALAAAVHSVGDQDGISIADAFAALAAFDFTRTGTGLHGTLVDSPVDSSSTAKARTGRDARAGASLVLAKFVREQAAA